MGEGFGEGDREDEQGGDGDSKFFDVFHGGQTWEGEMPGGWAILNLLDLLLGKVKFFIFFVNMITTFLWVWYDFFGKSKRGQFP